MNIHKTFQKTWPALACTGLSVALIILSWHYHNTALLFIALGTTMALSLHRAKRLNASGIPFMAVAVLAIAGLYRNWVVAALALALLVVSEIYLALRYQQPNRASSWALAILAFILVLAGAYYQNFTFLLSAVLLSLARMHLIPSK